MFKYAGIGSRETPEDILEFMKWLAQIWGESGWVLRSGGAKGADTAFEIGCDLGLGPKEIFRSADCTDEALKHAAQYHPNWPACGKWARKLHGRNSLIILGERLNDPVDFVVCWTPNGELTGGTAQGIRVAQANDIPVYNIGDQDTYDAIIPYFESIIDE